MRLKIFEFEKLARLKGYKSGRKLMSELGFSKEVYIRLKQGKKLHSDVLTAIYEAFGQDAMYDVVSFDEDNFIK